jgi:hypothetical protein
MLEKISQAAEKMATSTSRRQFLGRVGRGAMALAAAIGGVLASSGVAHGKRPIRVCSFSSVYCSNVPVGSACFSPRGTGRCRQIRGTQDCVCDTDRRRR